MRRKCGISSARGLEEARRASLNFTTAALRRQDNSPDSGCVSVKFISLESSKPAWISDERRLFKVWRSSAPFGRGKNGATQYHLDVNCALHHKERESIFRSRLAASIELERVGARSTRGNQMANSFEDFQNLSKTQLESAAVTSKSFVKGLQAIAAETTDYSKKSLESGTAFLEKLLGVKSLESAIQLQSEYAKTSYADFVAQATKIGELYSNLAKDTLKSIETAIPGLKGVNP
jgi:hypothetical protein